MSSTTILISIGCTILSIVWYGLRKMCPKCHRWNGLKKIEKEHHHQEERFRNVTKTTVHKDKYGNKIGSTERQEQEKYHVTYYTYKYQCNKCGHGRIRIHQSGKYIKEAAVIFIAVFLCSAYFVENKDEVKNSNKSVENTNTELNNNTPVSNAYVSSRSAESPEQNKDTVSSENISQESTLNNNQQDSVQ